MQLFLIKIDAVSSKLGSDIATRSEKILADLLLLSRLQIELVTVVIVVAESSKEPMVYIIVSVRITYVRPTSSQ